MDIKNGCAIRAARRLTRPENPRSFEITERDIDILAFVARVRFATSDQIIRFTAGSEKNVGTRIRLLFWHAYLHRADDQLALITLFNHLGNTAGVFSLAPAGKQLLAQRGIMPMKSRARFPLIPHTVATTEILLSLALASRVEDAPRLIDHADLLPFMPETTRNLEHPFRFKVPHHDGGTQISLSVDPDPRHRIR